MTVVSPVEIGCQRCDAGPGEPCVSRSGQRRTDYHAIRWADSRVESVRPGDTPREETADIVDFGAAWRRKQAEKNGVDLG